MVQAEIEPRTAADAPPPCDQPGCTEPSVFSYTWEWGAKGTCCATHQMLLQQSSENLQRRVNFSPLNLAAAPITRDERAKLKGEVYALEMECVDLKERGSALFTENTALTRQVQALTVRQRETEAQREDARRELAELGKQLEASQAKQGEMFDELTRLRNIEKFSELNVVGASTHGLAPKGKGGKA